MVFHLYVVFVMCKSFRECFLIYIYIYIIYIAGGVWTNFGGSSVIEYHVHHARYPVLPRCVRVIRNYYLHRQLLFTYFIEYHVHHARYPVLPRCVCVCVCV
jgi:hypothetical protein